jgi:hypothetical protein
MDDHVFVAEVHRVFNGENVGVTPRTLLSDVRWLPVPPRPDLGALDGTRYFLRWLFAGCDGLIETRCLPSKERRFWGLDQMRDLGRYIDIARTSENVYFGIATRRDATSGALDNCLHLPSLFVDMDFKIIPEDEARTRLTLYPRPPAAIVGSGGGLHCYWKLSAPLDLHTDAGRAKMLLRRLARALGADTGSAEPAHILRVPRTVNFKYTPKRPVVLESLDG